AAKSFRSCPLLAALGVTRRKCRRGAMYRQTRITRSALPLTAASGVNVKVRRSGTSDRRPIARGILSLRSAKVRCATHCLPLTPLRAFSTSQRAQHVGSNARSFHVGFRTPVAITTPLGVVYDLK